jgi:hypothetical protein
MIRKLFKKIKKQNNVFQSDLLANHLIKNKWWCSNCKEWVNPRDVTYEERHDVRSGGCGHVVL